MSLMHKFKELYQGAKMQFTGRLVSWSYPGRSFDRRIAKRTAEDTRFDSASYSQLLPYIQKYKFITQKVVRTEHLLHFIENSRLKKGQLLASCKCCGNKRPFTQSSRCPAFPWKKCNKCKKVCKDLSAEGSQAAAVEHEIRFNHDVHTCFGSVELDSVSGTRKKNLELNWSHNRWDGCTDQSRY